MATYDNLGKVGKHITAFGLSRSGNHCIFNWIINNYVKNGMGPVWYLNGCRSGYGDIYSKECIVYDGLGTKKLSRRGVSAEVKSSSDKPILFTSFENLPHIMDFENKTSYFNYNLSNSTIKDEFTIHILRDPFNLLATYMKHPPRLGQPKKWQESIDLWKYHAKQVLGYKKYLIEPITTILYNKWKKDKSYRKSIVSSFGIKNYCDSVDFVPSYGAGSSFDGFDFQGKGSQMKTLERWKTCRENEWYIDQIRQDEVLDLSAEIFPELTQKIRRHISKFDKHKTFNC